MFPKMQAILKDITDYINNEGYSDIVLIALNEAKGTMQNRIFDSSDGSKDVTGKPMANNAKTGQAYSVSWGQVRKSYGRQTKVKDFSFTGSLVKSIQIVQEGGKYKITMSDSAKANLIEKNEGKDIFSLSDEEQEVFKDVFRELFMQDLKKIVAKHV